MRALADKVAKRRTSVGAVFHKQEEGRFARRPPAEKSSICEKAKSRFARRPPVGAVFHFRNKQEEGRAGEETTHKRKSQVQAPGIAAMETTAIKVPPPLHPVITIIEHGRRVPKRQQ
jgi:hypothetical protein